MTIVLVHGNPETEAVWDDLVPHLRDPDVVRLSPPGFGSAIPAGFDCSVDAYRDWLAGELSKFAQPVDLVGHDWGGVLVQRVVSVRPDLIRTWACGNGPIDVEYVWHDMAQMWQTPDVGEQVMTAMTPEATALALADECGGEERAKAMAAKVDGTMKECVLTLYRSAIMGGAEWADQVDTIKTPGLVLWGDRDPYVGPEFGQRLAQRTGARLVMFENTGHWWPVLRAEDAARELEALWSQ